MSGWRRWGDLVTVMIECVLQVLTTAKKARKLAGECSYPVELIKTVQWSCIILIVCL